MSCNKPSLGHRIHRTFLGLTHCAIVLQLFTWPTGRLLFERKLFGFFDMRTPETDEQRALSHSVLLEPVDGLFVSSNQLRRLDGILRWFPFAHVVRNFYGALSHVESWIRTNRCKRAFRSVSSRVSRLPFAENRWWMLDRDDPVEDSRGIPSTSAIQLSNASFGQSATVLSQHGKTLGSVP